MKKKILSLLQILLLGVSLFFGYKAYQELKPLWNINASNSALKSLAVVEKENPFDRKIDFKALKEVNQDIIGWVYIPDTNVDYPIFKGQTDEEYLFKDINNEYNRLGSVTTFSDTDSSFNKGQNFIYAHNGVKDMMFGNLIHYTEKEFRENHPVFYVYTETKIYECPIFSIFIADETEEIYNHDFEIASIQHISRVNELIDRNSYDDLEKQDMDSFTNSEVFTLLTCYGGIGTPNRLLINGFVSKIKYIL